MPPSSTWAAKAKKIIICCDGTWMNSDSSQQVPSNVTRLARAIKPEDSTGRPQIVYYQAGIGTDLGLINQAIGGGFGYGYSPNVREAYSFLAHNYWQKEDSHPATTHEDLVRSDAIFLLGFSRGAYTARSLGGLIAQLGLLRKQHMRWFLDIFQDWQHAGQANYKPVFWSNWTNFNRMMDATNTAEFCIRSNPNDISQVKQYLAEYRNGLLTFDLVREVKITAIGVFDTVGALGIPVLPIFQSYLHLPSFLHSYQFTNTALDGHIENAFQALALDEHRSPFYPTIWEKDAGDKTNLKQVWFAGAHSNIGGAYADTASANLSLAWMMDQLAGDDLERTHETAWKSEKWLEFEQDYLSTQVKENLKYQQLSYGMKRRWGFGAIYNSLTFPQILAGARVRRPMRTHPIDGLTGFTDNTRLLHNTNEQIHCSVRYRTINRGSWYEADPDAGKIRQFILLVARKLRAGVQWLCGKTVGNYYDPRFGGPLKDWRPVEGYTPPASSAASDSGDESDAGTIASIEEMPRDVGMPLHGDMAQDGDTVQCEENRGSLLVRSPDGFHHRSQTPSPSRLLRDLNTTKNLYQRPHWVYVGNDPLSPRGAMIPEARLGTREMELLEMYEDSDAVLACGVCTLGKGGRNIRFRRGASAPVDDPRPDRPPRRGPARELPSLPKMRSLL